MLIDRLPETVAAFHAADPTNTGFVSLYDFRQALYVDAAVDYATVMKVSKATKTDKVVRACIVSDG